MLNSYWRYTANTDTDLIILQSTTCRRGRQLVGEPVSSRLDRATIQLWQERTETQRSSTRRYMYVGDGVCRSGCQMNYILFELVGINVPTIEFIWNSIEPMYPAGTWRINNVIITSKRWFDVIMTSLLRHMKPGWKMGGGGGWGAEPKGIKYTQVHVCRGRGRGSGHPKLKFCACAKRIHGPRVCHSSNDWNNGHVFASPVMTGTTDGARKAGRI